MSQLPLTLTKLSQSLALLSVQQTNPGILPSFSGNALDIAQSILNFVDSARTVGAAYGLTASQSRTNIRRYGIDSPIEPFAIVPGPIKTTLEIKMISLYIQDDMQAFAFESGNVAFQTRPLIIHEITNAPEITFSDLTGPVQKLIEKAGVTFGVKLSDIPFIHTYVGCWISERNTQYSLEDNQMVMHNIKMDVAQVINPDVLETVVAKGTRRLVSGLKLLPPLVQVVREQAQRVLKTKLPF